MIIRCSVYKLLCIVTLVVGVFVFARLNTVINTSGYGVDWAEAESFESYGQLYLVFDGADDENLPEILVNGVSKGKINGKTKTLDIFDKCIVEIDTRKLKKPVTVQIDGKSKNVLTDCVGRIVTGQNSIQSLGMFTIKQGM